MTAAADLCPSSTVLVEKVNPPTLDNYHPLAMSVLELRWHVGKHIVFRKWDVLCSLGDTRSQSTKASSEDTITLPTSTDIEGVEPQPVTTQGTGSTVLAKPATLSAETNPSVATEVPPKIR